MELMVQAMKIRVGKPGSRKKKYSDDFEAEMFQESLEDLEWVLSEAERLKSRFLPKIKGRLKRQLWYIIDLASAGVGAKVVARKG